MKPTPDGEDFTFVYEYFFKEFDISFLLSAFECRMLMMINVALSQLHPNSSAFLKAFLVLCCYLHIMGKILEGEAQLKAKADGASQAYTLIIFHLSFFLY